MILSIYSIRDIVSNQYGNPLFLVNDGHAIRSVSDEVNNVTNNTNNMFFNHPEDFELVKLGTFDTDSGLFVTAPPVQVVTLIQLKAVPKRQ